jgi:hypothetical protein
MVFTFVLSVFAMKLSKEQKEKVNAWLFGEVKEWLASLPWREHKEMYHHSYQNWWRGGNGYACLGQGGTGQMYLRMWYYYKLKNGKSNEWRPSVIINAALKHLGY